MFPPQPRRDSIAVVLVGCFLTWSNAVFAHDIPTARIDRSIQVVLAPGRLQVHYEVSLAELTLAQDLRQLDGEGFVGDRSALFERYARVVGPLNARGLLTSVDGEERELQPVDFAIAVEDHPRILFRFEVEIPDHGQLSISDTNYASSEGSSRLGLRVGPGVEVTGDVPPVEVAAISPRLPWELTDAEERRTKRLQVRYGPRRGPAVVTPAPPVAPRAVEPTTRASGPGLTWLLDHRTPSVAFGWLITALFLGMAHAIQPGHGKTLVAAATVGGPKAPLRGVALGLITAGCHLLGVFAIAAILWLFPTHQFAAIHVGFARGSGFLVAAVGLFRVGRSLAGIEPRVHAHFEASQRGSAPSLWALGLAGGFVPCWDAVALVVVAGSMGQLGWGILLLVAFSLGLGCVLIGVGWVAGQFGAKLQGIVGAKPGSRWLGLVSGIVLAAIGLGLLNS